MTTNQFRADVIAQLTTKIESDLHELLTLCPDLAHAKTFDAVNALFYKIGDGEVSEEAADLLWNMKMTLLDRELLWAHERAAAEAA